MNGPWCPACNESGHSAAEPHCSVCRRHPAVHKVREEWDGPPDFHELTATLCCDHFREVLGDCSRWPTAGHREEADAPPQ